MYQTRRQMLWQSLKEFLLTEPKAWFIIFMCALAVFALSVVFYKNLNLPLPFAYNSDVIQPLDDTLCPGEWLEYHVSFTVTQTPVVLVTIRTWYHVDTQFVALFDEMPDWSGHLHRETVQGHRMFRVPMQLDKPGEWEFRVVVESLESDAAGYVVPFTISPDCFGD